MRTTHSGYSKLRSMVRHAATILFCGLAALGFMRCTDPVSVPMNGVLIAPSFTHFGAPDYAVTSIPMAQDPTPSGTHPNLAGDDNTTGPIPIGFDFEFFGTTYTEINISTNGFVGFDPDMGNGCCWGEVIPLDDSPNHQNNIIAGLWSDLSPDADGQIWYGMTGAAPNRRFVVHYQNVSFFRAGETERLDVQIKLFEGTNVIEIHSAVVPPSSHQLTQGIENAAGTDAYFVAGRVAANFELVNDAVRFTPPLDNTPPVIVANVAGTVGNNGWYTSNVGLTWSVTDGESAVSSTSGCAAVSIVSDQQATTYTCSASSLGGSSSESATVKRDATDPAVGYSGNAVSYTVDQSVNITCSASDTTSGLASAACANVSGDAYSFGVGTSSFSASATDNAGNSAGAAVSFTVTVTPASLCNLTRRWVVKSGMANSLCQQLEIGAYAAFRNRVESQSGRAIPPDKAALLISLSNHL